MEATCFNQVSFIFIAGKYAVVNPYSDSYSFEYETQVYFSIPNSGLEIAVSKHIVII